LTRRQFLRLTALGAAATGTGVYAWGVEPHWLEIVRRSLPVRGLPRSLDGATLMQISDVHAGLQVDDRYLIETFQRLADLMPDIVVVTGDLVSYHPRVFQQVETVYRHFPCGRLATVGVLGNHDYGHAWRHPEIADRIAEIVGAFGIDVLRNEFRRIAGLQIVGLGDLWTEEFAPGRVLPLVDPKVPAIYLSHNPDSVDEPVWDGCEGWILSGHTHGGQCKAPFLPPPLLPVRNRRYTAGEFELSGNRRLYINRGLGYSLRVRVNVRPEVTLFELSPEPA
jgi:uncharacterized protein